MKCARKASKTILAVLLVGVVISASSWAFAQGGAGNYTFLASKLGDDHIAAPEMIELSDVTLNRTENISLDGNARLKEKPEQTTRTLTGRRVPARAISFRPLKSRLSSFSSTGMTGLPTPTPWSRTGKKPTTRTCQPSGTTSFMGPGGSTRTPST